jgi:hypothetical protein
VHTFTLLNYRIEQPTLSLAVSGEDQGKKPNQGNRRFAIVLVLLLSFLAQQSAFSQATVPGQSTEKNWSCLKRKDLLRDK